MRAKRLQKITNMINKQDTISFTTLCKEFKISPATMRRDLKYLDESGLIKRVHGGAQAIRIKQTLFETPYHDRLHEQMEEKKRIAIRAMNYIHDNDVIILDSSTTNCALATLLASSDRKILVITNDIHIGCILQEHPYIELLLIGGNIRPTFNSTMGVFAEMMLGQILADKVFLGADAISPEHGVQIFHVDEINCKRLMMARSKETYLLCDHTKFSTSAVLQVCPITNVHHIITDNGLSDEKLAEYNSFGLLEIIRA